MSKRVYALDEFCLPFSIGWSQAAKRISSHTHKVGGPDYVFAFHDNEEIGPKMLARIAKKTGLRPEDLKHTRRMQLRRLNSRPISGPG